MDETQMAINLEKEGNYRLMATVWDMEKMMPITQNINIVTEVEK
jgi:hypothetical protein